ncbi:hypothetical protein [Frigoriglobus tundricola]|uniref:Uncharacterized protein n=1 Tax=Frigoriglobus tundricola TaxID=2774151 RepID=A0A6M5Z5R6_9BACT|nr:hypothetical protein [Frigoriglobus tundricola]QJX01045.1 hypothetical protein FTUN_8683 [Frigoriglobus tundricola]
MSDTPPPTATTPSPPTTHTSPAPGAEGHTVRGKIFLAVTAVLFVGWLSWLGYTALNKSRGPVVSRAQAAAASVAVRAKLDLAEADRESMLVRPAVIGGQQVTVLKGQAEKPAYVVTVVEKLHANGPEAGTKIGVTNLPACHGFSEPGEYLLLLNKDDGATLDGHPVYTVVGQQRSPGADLDGVGPPVIYPWNADVEKQVQRVTR